MGPLKCSLLIMVLLSSIGWTEGSVASHVKPIQKLLTHGSMPDGFTWIDAPITIYQNQYGKFETDFDVANYQIIGTGKTYYVSLTGNNNNDGLTLATAFATVEKAIHMEDVDTVLVDGGVYRKVSSGLAGLGTVGVGIVRPCTIKALPNQKVIFSMYQQLFWTKTTGKTDIYQSSRSGIGAVYDSKFLDSNKDYQQYTLKTSIDEVEANAGSWYTDGTLVYVHTSDNRVADDYLRPYFNNLNCIDNVQGYDVYLEGIDFEGGSSTFRAVNTVSLSPSVYVKNCTFKYSTANDAVNMLGVTNAYFQNCLVAKNYGDGFNYHINNSVISNTIEVNCVGRDNGGGNLNIDNGSTMHDGGKIIRVNGAYFRNKGSNVGDINVGTQSWNLGCVGFESLAQSDDAYKTNFTAHADAEMWNDGCYSYGSLNALTVQNGAKMHLRNSRMEGKQTLEGTGTVDTY